MNSVACVIRCIQYGNAISNANVRANANPMVIVIWTTKAKRNMQCIIFKCHNSRKLIVYGREYVFFVSCHFGREKLKRWRQHNVNRTCRCHPINISRLLQQTYFLWCKIHSYFQCGILSAEFIDSFLCLPSIALHCKISRRIQFK